MEKNKKNHGRVRGKFLAVPPVIDLNSEKKNELLKDIFDKKTTNPVVLNKNLPIKISKLEKVALPVLVVAAFFVGWSLLFNLFFYKTKVDLKNEAKAVLSDLLKTTSMSFSYLKEDVKAVSLESSLDLSAGVGFLGSKIADLAEISSIKTMSLIESLNKL
jgi:cell division protein FtsL